MSLFKLGSIFALKFQQSMIQRIQTLYLTLAAIALALIFAFPLAQFFSETGTYYFKAIGLKNMVPGGDELFNPTVFLPLPILVVVILFMLVFAISQFKNRTFQIRLVNITVLLTAVLIAGIFFLYIPMIEKKIAIIPDYSKSFGVYVPLVSLVFQILATRAIKRDDQLVRSADRLR